MTFDVAMETGRTAALRTGHRPRPLRRPEKMYSRTSLTTVAQVPSRDRVPFTSRREVKGKGAVAPCHRKFRFHACAARNSRYQPAGGFTAGAGRSTAFTIIELLVVMAIIAVLFSAVLVGGSAVLTSARERNTRAVMQIMLESIEEFKRESPMIITAKQPAGAGQTVRYQARYGAYPPDEVEVFTRAGLPGSSGGGSLAPGGAEFVPHPASGSSAYPAMKFYQAGNPATELEFRDLVALIIAIEELAPKAAAILNQIPDSNWSAGIPHAQGGPAQFLDRNGNGTWDPEVDEQVRLLVDDWGVPFSYFAQRDFDPEDTTPTESSNVAGWNQTSTELIRLNKGQPLLVSYGPNGPDQLRMEVQTADNATATMVTDWMDTNDERRRINDPYNLDNVYVDPTLTERFSEGVAGGP